MSREIYSACRIAVNDCMGLQLGERVAVITDEPCRKIGLALFETVRELGNEVVLAEIVPRPGHGLSIRLGLIIQEMPGPGGRL